MRETTDTREDILTAAECVIAQSGVKHLNPVSSRLLCYRK
jgi:hypothetical protein